MLLPGVVAFVFTKFQRHLSTFTSSDLTVCKSTQIALKLGIKTKATTPGNNICTLLITFIAFTSFISSKFETLFFPYKLSYYATSGPYYAWATCGETEYKSKKNVGIW